MASGIVDVLVSFHRGRRRERRAYTSPQIFAGLIFHLMTQALPPQHKVLQDGLLPRDVDNYLDMYRLVLDAEEVEGRWVLKSIKVVRDVPMENGHLFGVAAEKVQKGLGRALKGEALLGKGYAEASGWIGVQ